MAALPLRNSTVECNRVMNYPAQGLFQQDDRARQIYPLLLLARRIALAGRPVDPDESPQ